jgi:hypothetical protein
MKSKQDIWHYARTDLAKQILGLFESGLASALVFFAPRRMGKTEFLRKDIQPLAEAQGWKVFYFSFLDAESNAQEEFTQALIKFAENVGIAQKVLKALKQVKSITGEAAGFKASIELNHSRETTQTLKEVLSHLAEKNNILLLMDEIQVLAKSEKNASFVAALRTTLDTNKDSLKVIFTGSSREGLRKMFSQAKAPFFHFGQNLPFPELDREFIDHLCHVFKQVTQRTLNSDQLWKVFESMEKVPQLIRSLVERLALQPNLSIEDAQKKLMADIFGDRTFAEKWEECSSLEKLLITDIAEENKQGLFSEHYRSTLAKTLGIPKLSVAMVQSAIRSLERRLIIGKQGERQGYFIEDPNFKRWLLQIK